MESVREPPAAVLADEGDTHRSTGDEDLVQTMITPKLSKTARSLGLVLLVGVVCIWVASSVVIQFIFTEGDFDKPFFLTYLNTSLFTLYLFGFPLRLWRVDRNMLAVVVCALRGRRGAGEDVERASLLAAPAASAAASERERASTASSVQQVQATCRAALLICPMWFLANFAFNISLEKTSVSSNTILSTTSGLFTVLLSARVLRERLTAGKVLACILSVGGVALISLADKGNSSGDSIEGDIIALISAVFYACYTVMLKKLLPEDDQVSMPMFFGFLGLFNLVFLWPLFPILAASGAEPFAIPHGTVAMSLVVNGLVGTVLSDYLWARSVLLLSPSISTVGLSLTVPLAMIADLFLHGKRFAWDYLVGTALVLGGFFLINRSSAGLPADMAKKGSPEHRDERQGRAAFLGEPSE